LNFEEKVKCKFSAIEANLVEKKQKTRVIRNL